MNASAVQIDLQQLFCILVTDHLELLIVDKVAVLQILNEVQTLLVGDKWVVDRVHDLVDVADSQQTSKGCEREHGRCGDPDILFPTVVIDQSVKTSLNRPTCRLI